MIDYFDGEIPTQNVTYVITGHSLGGAVGNLISLRLFKKRVPTEALYNYNFACPLVGAGTDDATLWNYHGLHNNIININNRFDVVPSRPIAGDYDIFTLWSYGLKGWTSFKRFGVSYWFDNTWAHFFDAHNMCAYIDFLDKELDKSHFISTEYYVDTVSVHCPVDVVILDSQGKPIAGTDDNTPNYFGYNEGEKAAITVNGDNKTLQIFNEDKIEVRLRATDSGEMEYMYSRRELIGERNTVFKSFSAVKLTAGKEMVSYVGSNMNAEDIKLFVIEGDTCSAEVLEDGSEKVLHVDDQKESLTKYDEPTEHSESKESSDKNNDRSQNNIVLIIAIATAIIIVFVVLVIVKRWKK